MEEESQEFSECSEELQSEKSFSLAEKEDKEERQGEALDDDDDDEELNEKYPDVKKISGLTGVNYLPCFVLAHQCRLADVPEDVYLQFCAKNFVLPAEVEDGYPVQSKEGSTDGDDSSDPGDSCMPDSSFLSDQVNDQLALNRLRTRRQLHVEDVDINLDILLRLQRRARSVSRADRRQLAKERLLLALEVATKIEASLGAAPPGEHDDDSLSEDDEEEDKQTEFSRRVGPMMVKFFAATYNMAVEEELASVHGEQKLLANVLLIFLSSRHLYWQLMNWLLEEGRSLFEKTDFVHVGAVQRRRLFFLFQLVEGGLRRFHLAGRDQPWEGDLLAAWRNFLQDLLGRKWSSKANLAFASLHRLQMLVNKALEELVERRNGYEEAGTEKEE